MTKEFIFNILNKAIKHIDYNFNAESGCDDIEAQMRASIPPFSFSTDAGITKAVIIIKGCPFVIKIPFVSMFDEDYYEDMHYEWEEGLDTAFEEFAQMRREEEKDENYILTSAEIALIRRHYEDEHPEPECGDTRFYTEFMEADIFEKEKDLSDLEHGWDYCATEAELYARAEEEGLGAYFAEEALLGYIDNHPVYYQTRCTPFSSTTQDYNSKEYQVKKTMSHKVCESLKMECFNAIWIADFIKLYGVEELKRLNDFLLRYEIEDLRDCNIGYLDDAPILFDYSGYREWQL